MDVNGEAERSRQGLDERCVADRSRSAQAVIDMPDDAIARKLCRQLSKHIQQDDGVEAAGHGDENLVARSDHSVVTNRLECGFHQHGRSIVSPLDGECNAWCIGPSAVP